MKASVPETFLLFLPEHQVSVLQDPGSPFISEAVSAYPGISIGSTPPNHNAMTNQYRAQDWTYQWICDTPTVHTPTLATAGPWAHADSNVRLILLRKDNTCDIESCGVNRRKVMLSSYSRKPPPPRAPRKRIEKRRCRV